jgi:hypothetical protein
MVTRFRDGSAWRIGTDEEVAWIAEADRRVTYREADETWCNLDDRERGR